MDRCSLTCKISYPHPFFPFSNMSKIILGQKKNTAFLYTVDKKQMQTCFSKKLYRTNILKVSKRIMIHLMLDSTLITDRFVQDQSTTENKGRNLNSRLLFT